MNENKTKKTYTLKLDLTNSRHLEIHQKIQKELNTANAPLRAMGTVLGKRARGKLLTESHILLEMIGNMPKGKIDHLIRQSLEGKNYDKIINELVHIGYRLQNPDSDIEKGSFLNKVIRKMKNPDKEMKALEGLAIQHFKDLGRKEDSESLSNSNSMSLIRPL